MTKKDYVAIARIMEGMRLRWAEVAPAGMQDDYEQQLAEMLARDNPRFDRQRFLEACRGK